MTKVFDLVLIPFSSLRPPHFIAVNVNTKNLVIVLLRAATLELVLEI